MIEETTYETERAEREYTRTEKDVPDDDNDSSGIRLVHRRHYDMKEPFQK